MWKGVTVVTKPTEDAVSLTQLKEHLGIDGSEFDTLLPLWRAGAAARIDGPDGIGYALMQQTWRKAMDAFPSTILLPGAPIKSVTSIKYIDTDGAEQTLSSSLYRVDLNSEPVRITPAFGETWPATRAVTSAVWVDYVLGESDSANLEGDFIDAILLLVAHRMANREAASEGQMSPLPLGVEWILDQHRRNAAAA